MAGAPHAHQPDLQDVQQGELGAGAPHEGSVGSGATPAGGSARPNLRQVRGKAHQRQVRESSLKPSTEKEKGMAKKLVPNQSNDDRSPDYIEVDVGSGSTMGQLSENVRVTGELPKKPEVLPDFGGKEKPEDHYNGP